MGGRAAKGGRGRPRRQPHAQRHERGQPEHAARGEQDRPKKERITGFYFCALLA